MKLQLAEWQSNFVNTYLTNPKPCSLLCAAPGAGKTITSLFTACKMVEKDLSHKILIISAAAGLRDQWEYVFDHSIETSTTYDRFDSITVQSLSAQKRTEYFEKAKKQKYFIIADDFNFGRTSSLVL